jgi:hypothetical protein
MIMTPVLKHFSLVRDPEQTLWDLSIRRSDALPRESAKAKLQNPGSALSSSELLPVAYPVQPGDLL